MNRIILLLSVFIFSSYISFSQDTIYKKNDAVIISKVLEVLQEEVKFKKFENIDGPTYTLKKSEIKKIVYKNGSEDIYNASIEADTNVSNQRSKAQLIIHFGPTFATFRGDAESTQRKLGFAGGISIEIPINSSSGNYFDFTLLYEQKGARFNNQTIENNTIEYDVTDMKESLEYITLATTYKKYFDKKQTVFGRIGVYAGYLYEATGSGNFKSSSSSEAKNISISIKDYYTAIDVGGSIGLGFRVPLQTGKFQSDLIFDARYNFSFFDINNAADYTSSAGTEIFNANFLLMAGIRFPF